MYKDIILVLCDGWGDSQFKHWVQKHFILVKNSDVNVVYSSGKASRPVVTYEKLYTKLYECHNRVGHHGRDKTWKEVLHEKYVCVILHQARAILKALPNFNHIDLSVLRHIHIIGDLHGQLADLLHIFNA
ncbi:unnamed protein product, partial [Rotaria socialis]